MRYFIFFLLLLLIAPIFTGKEPDPKYPVSKYKILYVIRFQNSVNDTVPELIFAYNNRIEYFKEDTTKHISSFKYQLDTLNFIEFEW